MRLSYLRQFCRASAFASICLLALDLTPNNQISPQPWRRRAKNKVRLIFAIDTENESDVNYELSDWLQDAQPPAIVFDPQVAAPQGSSDLAAIVFGGDDVERSSLSQRVAREQRRPVPTLSLERKGHFESRLTAETC